MKGSLRILLLFVYLFSVIAEECPLLAEDPEVDVLLPHETDCTMFYKCSHGRKYLQVCPADLHFSVKQQYCEWPYNANCQTS